MVPCWQPPVTPGSTWVCSSDSYRKSDNDRNYDRQFFPAPPPCRALCGLSCVRGFTCNPFHLSFVTPHAVCMVMPGLWNGNSCLPCFNFWFLIKKENGSNVDFIECCELECFKSSTARSRAAAPSESPVPSTACPGPLGASAACNADAQPLSTASGNFSRCKNPG